MTLKRSLRAVVFPILLVSCTTRDDIAEKWTHSLAQDKIDGTIKSIASWEGSVAGNPSIFALKLICEDQAQRLTLSIDSYDENRQPSPYVGMDKWRLSANSPRNERVVKNSISGLIQNLINPLNTEYNNSYKIDFNQLTFRQLQEWFPRQTVEYLVTSGAGVRAGVMEAYQVDASAYLGTTPEEYIEEITARLQRTPFDPAYYRYEKLGALLGAGMFVKRMAPIVIEVHNGGGVAQFELSSADPAIEKTLTDCAGSPFWEPWWHVVNQQDTEGQTIESKTEPIPGIGVDEDLATNALRTQLNKVVRYQMEWRKSKSSYATHIDSLSWYLPEPMIHITIDSAVAGLAWWGTATHDFAQAKCVVSVSYKSQSSSDVKLICSK